MQRQEMLSYLSEVGADAGADLNDGDTAYGYFGWDITGDVLTISHEPMDEETGDLGEKVTRRWKLVEI